MNQFILFISQMEFIFWNVKSEYYFYQTPVFILSTRFKGSPDPSHFIFEISVGNRRIRDKTTQKWNNELPDRPKID